MAGKIHEKVEFWKEVLDPSDYVLNIIENGYGLPFVNEPPAFFAKNNKSSLENNDFVEHAITDLLEKGCVREIKQPAFCSNPLTVAESHGKLRLVLDLRHVNKYLQEYKFKYENLEIIAQLLEKKFYFGTFDLKSGYHHIKIAPEHQKYLGFTWAFSNGTTRYFEFLVLPFGLSSACYAFTKIMRPLVKRWRGFGIRCAVYIDDGIMGDLNFTKCEENISLITTDLSNAGFTLNFEKSQLSPTQLGKWLGFVIDTNEFKLFVPEDKIARLKKVIYNITTKNLVSAREISKVAGMIMSMKPAIGPLTQLLTRNMYHFIDEKLLWDSIHPLPKNVLTELDFWLKNINLYNGFQIKKNCVISKVVYTDASNHSYGGFVMTRLGNLIAKGSFNNHQKEQSSTFRELMAVRQVLQSFSSELAHEKVLWHSDNLNTARIIQKGSTKPSLQKLAYEIFDLCLKYDITISSKWIPREFNPLADQISKSVDSDDWGVDFETFNYIQSIYGNFTIDRFASFHNKKVERFNSKFFCPGTSGVNAFTQNWRNEFNWLCPPISLLGECLNHLKLCNGKGVLLVPLWKSSYFWPLLTPDGKVFYDFIKHYLLLQPYFISDCKSNNFRGFTNFLTVAFYVDFSH